MANHARYIVLLSTVAALFYTGAQESCAAPKVQVDQAVYDAGSVSEGKEISHEFIFGLMSVETSLENVHKTVRIKARVMKD